MILRRRHIQNSLVSHRLSFLFIALTFIAIPSNEVKAHSSEAKRMEPLRIINLGTERYIEQTVPVNVDVALRCTLFQPIWYRRSFSSDHNARDEEIEEFNGKNDLLIKSIQTKSAGYYSCFTPAGGPLRRNWSNLTLYVEDKSSDIASFQKVQTDEEAELNRDTLENVTTSVESGEEYLAPNLEKILDINKSYGEDLKIACNARLQNLNQKSNVFWYHNSTLLNSISLSGRFILKGKFMKIKYLKMEDAGLYMCRTCNANPENDCLVYKFRVHVMYSGFQRKTTEKFADKEEDFRESSKFNIKSSKLIMDVTSATPRVLNLSHTKTPTSQITTNPPFTTIFQNNADDDDDDGEELLIDSSAADQTKDVRNNDNVMINTSNTLMEGNRNSSNSTKEGIPEFNNSKAKLVENLHQPSGSTITLSCPYTANPKANITWTRNDTEINRAIGKVIKKKYSIALHDAITDDTGVYTCTICNSFGCIKHSTQIVINDRLRAAPIHSDSFPHNITALVNTTATFECRVYSDLEPSFIWISYVNGTNSTIRTLESRVPSFSSLRDIKNFTHIIKVWPTDNEDRPNILRLENVTHDHEGWYTCIAANQLGQTKASAYLTVVDVLPSIKPNHTTIIAFASLVLLLLLFAAVFIIYVLRKLKHERLLKNRIATIHQWTKKVIIYKPSSCDAGSCTDLQIPVIKIEKQRTTFTTSSQNGDVSQCLNEYEFPLDSNWELPRNQLKLSATLGEGAFGRVVKAEAYGLSRPDIVMPSNSKDSITVAVKMVKEEHTDADMASLVREMEVMKIIGKHKNIINLLACCTQNGPLWVIVEFAPHGNLKDFLKQNRPPYNLKLQHRHSGYLEEEKVHLTERKLISFAFQIARGMEYLASRKCIHRDLAARNVLVSEDYVMKIADFGLARDIQDTDYYRKNTNGRLPIKWMAPESLHEKFYDSQSDVFSYGVLLWEIMTYGEQPYPNIMSAEELYSFLLSGQRMEKPPRCSLNIYMLMRQCWHFDATARPTFIELVENLEKILQLSQNHEEYLDLSMPILETPPSSSDEEGDIEYADNTDDDSAKANFQDTKPLRYQYTYKFK